MTLLSGTTNFVIQDAAAVQDSLDVFVVQAGGPGTGMGRLVHPTFGTLDYTLPPHQWTNIDDDLIIPPIWSSTKTLTSGANTLWAGNLRDVEVEERWVPEAGLSMPLDMLRSLLAFWVNPPDPAVDFIEWYPTYTSTLGFKVAIAAVETNGVPLTLSPQTKYIELVEFPVTVKLRIVERIV